ncbi:hypothetical protein ABPG74_018839 [Tetrahymena malaccensis]
MAKYFENWNSEFIQQFSSNYTYLYEDNSERLGKFKVFQTLKKNSEYSLVAIKEVEIHQVEEKLKQQGLYMHQAVDEYVDDFMKAIKKVFENQMNLHQSILQMIAYECQLLEVGSIQKLQHIKFYYEYFPNNILQEAKRKFCFNDIGFQETEIWQILYNISSLMFHLEGQNRWIGNLIPENIYYAHTNGEVKILPYKMSLLDDIQKTFTYVKTNVNSPMNKEFTHYQNNTQCNLDITKHFKSDILSLGISLLRIMICNELFSFEVQEQLKRGCIDQLTLQELVKRCQQKYNGFIIKILIAMTDENEYIRPTGTQLFKFLSNHSQQIKQGLFNGSQIQDFTLFEDVSNFYDFKKSPSLYASQKYSSIIRKNSISLDEQNQEDDNIKMQKILDSVKKIINKKAVTDNNYNSEKGQDVYKLQSDSKGKAQNQTYESFTEITDKQSVSEFQQIQTDNQIQSNISLVPTFTNGNKQIEIQKSNQYSFKSQVDIPLPNQKKQPKKQLLNEKPNTEHQVLEQETCFQNNYIQNNSFFSNFNLNSQNQTSNYFNTPLKLIDQSQILANQQNKNKCFQILVDKNIQTEDQDQATQALSQLHQKQLETIKLAYQELQKLTKDINSLNEQRNNLLDQNKRLMDINDKLIIQNKELAMAQLSNNQKLKENSKSNQESQKSKVVLLERQNHFQQIDLRQLKQTSFSQPPLLSQQSQYKYQHPSESMQQSNQISKTPLLAIPRRELDFSQSRSNSNLQTPSNRETRVKSLDNYSYQGQHIRLAQNYSVKPYCDKINQFDQDFIIQDEIMSKNQQNTFQSQVLSPQSNKISNIKSPKNYKILDLSHKSSILIEAETNQQIITNHSQNLCQYNKHGSPQDVLRNQQQPIKDNKQQKIDSSLVESQNIQRSSLRSTFQDITNQNLVRSELKEGKCINIYQIRNPSNSCDYSPQLSCSPQNKNIALFQVSQPNFNQNICDDQFKINNSLQYQQISQNQYFDPGQQIFNNQISQKQNDIFNNQNKQPINNQIVKKKSQADLNNTNQSHNLNRQSRVSTCVSNIISLSTNKNQEYLDKQINLNVIPFNQIAKNLNILTESSQYQQCSKSNHGQLDAKYQLKKSASLPKPSPTLNSSSYPDFKITNMNLKAREEQQNQVQKNNKNLNQGQLLNNFIQNQQSFCLQKKEQPMQQYSQIHKRQISLTELQNQSQNTAQSNKQTFDNKNENQQLKLKTISSFNIKLQSQEIDQKTGQKLQFQSYNLASSPVCSKQNSIRNSFFQSSQQKNQQKSDKQNAYQQNNQILLLQQAQKSLNSVLHSQSIDKAINYTENKVAVIRSPKSKAAQPPFLSMGVIKKIDSKMNDVPLKTFQSNSKSQLLPK